MSDITPLIERIEKRATEEGVLDLLALSQLKATLQGLERERDSLRDKFEAYADSLLTRLSAAESRAARAEALINDLRELLGDKDLPYVGRVANAQLAISLDEARTGHFTFRHKPGCPVLTAAGGMGQCTCLPVNAHSGTFVVRP